MSTEDNPYQSSHAVDQFVPIRRSAIQGAARGAKLGVLWVGGIVSLLVLVTVVGLVIYVLYKTGDVREVGNRMFTLGFLPVVAAPLLSAGLAAVVCGAIMGIGTAIENRWKR
jgi:hypothetical protein